MACEMVCAVDKPPGLRDLTVAYGIVEDKRHLLEPTKADADAVEIDRLMEVVAGADPTLQPEAKREPVDVQISP